MSRKTTKKIFKNTIKLMDTFYSTSKKIDIDDIQMYITDTDGTICEIHLSVDEDGVLHKNFDIHDSLEEMREQHEEMGFHQFFEEDDKPLLN